MVRYAGLALIAFGIAALVLDRSMDVAWSVLLVVIGVLAQRVAPPAGLALYSVVGGWTALAAGLVGRWPAALVAAGLTLLALVAFQAAWRTAPRPLPARPALAVGSLTIGVLGTVLLILAFGSGLLGFLTGLPVSAAFADTLTSWGIQSAVLAVGLAGAALVQRGRYIWAAPLGALAGATCVIAYLGLLLFAQG